MCDVRCKHESADELKMKSVKFFYGSEFPQTC